MSIWLLWVLEILPDLGKLFTALGLIGTFISSLALLYCFVLMSTEGNYFSGERKFAKKVFPAVKKLFTVLVVSLVVGTCSPSSEGIYRIMGGYFVTNIEGIEKLPENVVGAANKFLEEFNEEKEEE